MQLSNSKKSKLKWHEKWLMPIVILLIIASQWWLANTTHLTPWKGGGFGMFGTFDKSNMRFLTADAITQDGKFIQLDIHQSLDKVKPTLAHRLRVWPSEEKALKWGRELLKHSYVFLEEGPPQTWIPLLMKENPKLDLTDFFRRMGYPFYNLIYPTEIPKATAHVTKIKSIRLQFWQLKFDPKTTQMSVHPLTKVVEVSAG